MNTIKSSKEISYIFKKGIKYNLPFMLIIKLPLKSCKNTKYKTNNQFVCFIAGKKNGNAVWRNRAKRRLRSIYKDLKIQQEQEKVIFVAKKTLCEENYSYVLNETRKIINNA